MPCCDSNVICSVARKKVLEKRNEKINRRAAEERAVSSFNSNFTAEDNVQRSVALKRIKSVQNQAQIGKLPSSQRSSPPKVGSMSIAHKHVHRICRHIVIMTHIYSPKRKGNGQ